jgi:hypothetical protein
MERNVRSIYPCGRYKECFNPSLSPSEIGGEGVDEKLGDGELSGSFDLDFDSTLSSSE